VSHLAGCLAIDRVLVEGSTNHGLPNHSLPRKERGIFESGPGQLGAII